MSRCGRDFSKHLSAPRNPRRCEDFQNRGVFGRGVVRRLAITFAPIDLPFGQKKLHELCALDVLEGTSVTPKKEVLDHENGRCSHETVADNTMSQLPAQLDAVDALSYTGGMRIKRENNIVSRAQ